MHVARSLLAQRHWAVLLCVAALLLKLLVPAGYMLSTAHGRVAMTICTGFVEAGPPSDMPGMNGSMPAHGPKDHGKAEMPCPFASLAAAPLPAVDPVLLVALIAFIMAVGLRQATMPVPPGHRHLRPPLRGPPATF